MKMISNSIWNNWSITRKNWTTIFLNTMSI